MKICSTRKVTPTASFGGLAQRGRALRASSSRRTTTRLLYCSTRDRQRLVVHMDMVHHRLQARCAASARRAPAGPAGPGSTAGAIPPCAGRKPVRAGALGRQFQHAADQPRRRSSGRVRPGSAAAGRHRPAARAASRPHGAATSAKCGQPGAADESGHRANLWRARCPEMINRCSRSVKSQRALRRKNPRLSNTPSQGLDMTDAQHSTATPFCDRLRADRRMESQLGSVLRARPGLDREIHDHGRGADALGRARRQDDRVPRHRRRCLVHPHVRPGRAPPHPQGAEARRHQGRNHCRAAAHQRAGHPHDEPGRTDPARRTGGAAVADATRR